MDAWPSEPNRADQTIRMDLLRVQPQKPISGIITCRTQTGAYTHYWRGRTIKCVHPTCDACDAGRVARWYGFLSVWGSKTGRVALFEFTPACIPTIREYNEKFGTLRGAAIKLERRNWKTNSTVLMTLSPSPYDDSKIPPEPNIIAHLEHMWEIRTPPLSETLEDHDPTDITAATQSTNGRH